MKRDTGFSWQHIAKSDMDLRGTQVAIIGGTGGIGRAISLAMASRGAQVWVVGQTFRDTGVSGITFIHADLSLMSEAEHVARVLPADTLDMVVFTTGIFATRQRQETPEGIERDMAVSFLSRMVILNKLAPTLGLHRPEVSLKSRVFIMGYPGTGQKGSVDDLNSEKSYSMMAAHMNTVAGNEVLVLDSATRYPHLDVFGLNPGLIKTNIRSNVFAGNAFIFRLVEGLVGLFSPTAQTYADNLVPLLISADLSEHSGLMFNRKGHAILPSSGLTPSYIARFINAAQTLISKALP